MTVNVLEVFRQLRNVTTHRPRPGRAAPARPRIRPALEGLEDRWLPSVTVLAVAPPAPVAVAASHHIQPSDIDQREDQMEPTLPGRAEQLDQKEDQGDQWAHPGALVAQQAQPALSAADADQREDQTEPKLPGRAEQLDQQEDQGGNAVSFGQVFASR
jgi:hypothetical protein